MAIQYRVYEKNYKEQKGELLGVLAERRKIMRSDTVLISGLKWARSVFGKMAKDPHSIFVVPVSDDEGGPAP